MYKKIALLIALISIGGWANGSIGKGDCATSAEDSQLVEGYNTETCKENKSFQLRAMYQPIDKDITKTANKNEEAAVLTQQEIDNDKSLSSIQSSFNGTYSTSKAKINSLLLYISIAFLIFAAFKFTYSTMTSEKDLNEEKTNRYTFIGVILPIMFGIFLMLPTGHQSNTVVDRYFISNLVAMKNYFVSFLISTDTAEVQTGGLIRNKSETKIEHSIAMYNADLVVDVMNSASLQTLRTTKLNHEINGVPLDSTENRIYRYENNIYFNSYYKSQLLSENATAMFEKTMIDNYEHKIIYDSISSKYISEDASNLSTRVDNFVSEIRSATKNKITQDSLFIAVSNIIVDNLKNIVLKELNSNLNEHIELSKLTEELSCFKHADDKGTYKEAEWYIKYLLGKGEAIGNVDCVGLKNNEYVAYGKRTEAEINSEKESKQIILIDKYYRVFEKLETELVRTGITLNNSKHCIDIRREGEFTYVKKYNLCKLENEFSREFMNVIAKSFSMTTSAERTFVQTKYLKNNQLYSSLSHKFFDKEIAYFNSFSKPKMPSHLLNNKQYIDKLLNSQNGFSSTSNDLSERIYYSFKTLKNSLYDKDCKESFFVCADTNKAMMATSRLSFDLIETGITFATAGVVIEVGRFLAGKSSNKSKSAGVDISDKKTSTSTTNIAKSAIAVAVSALAIFAVLIIVSGIVVLFATALPVVVFTMQQISYEQLLMLISLLYGFRVMWLFRINDANNIRMNFMKMLNDALFIVFYPSILLVMFKIMNVLMGVVYTLLIQMLIDSASVGFVQAIATIIFTPFAFYYATMNMLQLVANFSDKFIELTIGNTGLGSVITETTDTIMRALTFGYIITAFLKASKTTKKSQ